MIYQGRKHYSSEYVVEYNGVGKYSDRHFSNGEAGKTSGFRTNSDGGPQAFNTHPVVIREAEEDAAVQRTPRRQRGQMQNSPPKKRPRESFGSHPNSRLEWETRPRKETVYTSSYERYPAPQAPPEAAVLPALDSGYGRQLTLRPPMNEARPGSEWEERLLRTQGPHPPSVPRLELGLLAKSGIKTPRGVTSRTPHTPRGPRGVPIGEDGEPLLRRSRGVAIGWKQPSGFTKADPGHITMPARVGADEPSSEYRDEFLRHHFADGSEPTPRLNAMDNASGYATGNKTTRAGVPGVTSTDPRDQYPPYIHPATLQKIRRKDPAEWTNICNMDKPRLSIYKAHYEKRRGEDTNNGSGSLSAADALRAPPGGLQPSPRLRGDAHELTWLVPAPSDRRRSEALDDDGERGAGGGFDISKEANRLDDPPSMATRMAIMNQQGTKRQLSSYVKNTQPGFGATEEDQERAGKYTKFCKKTIVQTSFMDPAKEFPPPPVNPKDRTVGPSGFTHGGGLTATASQLEAGSKNLLTSTMTPRTARAIVDSRKRK
jgi:hypothetical protein